jgi:hypothetical protein
MQCRLRQNLHFRTRDHDDLLMLMRRRWVIDMDTFVPMSRLVLLLYTSSNLFIAIQRHVYALGPLQQDITTSHAIEAKGNILGIW